MLTIHCPICDTLYLVGTRSIESLHNTREGRVVYARCPEGHRTVEVHRSSQPSVPMAPATPAGSAAA